MSNQFRRTKGVRVGKNESALDALRKIVPHWIHEKIEDPTYFLGYRIARECRCSECGYLSSFEKPKCPGCGADMNGF